MKKNLRNLISSIADGIISPENGIMLLKAMNDPKITKKTNKNSWSVTYNQSLPKEKGGAIVDNKYITQKQMKDMNYVTHKQLVSMNYVTEERMNEILDSKCYVTTAELDAKLEARLKPLYKALNIEWQ